MTPEEIKSRLKQKGLSQRDLARRFRKSQTTINFLINGPLKSKSLEKRLARAIGVSLKELRGAGEAA